jgi:hypothetical protein
MNIDQRSANHPFSGNECHLSGNLVVKNFAPHLLWLLGLSVLVFTIIYFGPDGIPYQDPTDEMRAYQARQMQKLNALAITGSFLFVVGVSWAFIRWIFRSILRRQVDDEIPS